MPTTTVHHARKGPTPPTSPLCLHRHTRSLATSQTSTLPTLPTATWRGRTVAMSRSRWSRMFAPERTPSSTSSSCSAPSGSVLCSTTSTKRKCYLSFLFCSFSVLGSFHHPVVFVILEVGLILGIHCKTVIGLVVEDYLRLSVDEMLGVRW